LKELCTSKRNQKLKRFENLRVKENVFIVTQQKFLAKCKDLSVLTILYTIGNTRFEKAWCEPRDHRSCSNSHAKTSIPGKPSKSGLIGVWHKDNLYLGTNTIGNGKPPPNEYWFANEKYKDDATKTVVLQ
jgi:hypothetical protein